MGKTKKPKPSQMARKAPLEEVIADAKFAKPKNRNKIRLRQDEEQTVIDSNLSEKILLAVREQQRGLTDLEPSVSQRRKVPKLGDDSDSDSDGTEETSHEHNYEELQVNEDDERALETFMKPNPLPTRNLASIILEKINEKETELGTQCGDSLIDIAEVDPKVRQLYEGVAQVLRSYRSGKLPKAFKMIHRSRNWEQLLQITEPENWSAASMYQATRIFISNLHASLARRFLEYVLLPRVRDDIAEYKRLNPHLYASLKKALFKPDAFMKGIVLPLLESGNCTLREAIIIGSVVAKNSIHMLQSAVALMKIAEMDYTGANSIFIRILLDKRYALPYKVVDAVVVHFLRFEWDKRVLPVLWHQALLTFVQRYSGVITSEQKDALLDLLKAHTHPSITQEIRRELQHAKCRDSESVEPSEMNVN